MARKIGKSTLLAIDFYLSNKVSLYINFLMRSLIFSFLKKIDRRWQKLIHKQKVMEIVFNY